MTIDLSKIQTTSQLAGLQNIGSTSATAIVNGTLPANGYLVTSFVVQFPYPNIISTILINTPSQSGDIAKYWFPVNTGLLQLNDTVKGYTINVFASSSASGRIINLTYVNQSQTVPVTLSNLKYNVTAHLYTYPWG